MKVYYNFWSKAFDLPLKCFDSAVVERVTSGKYLEKYGDEFVFQFSDLSSGKEVWILPPSRLKSAAEGLQLAFDDLDFGFSHPSEFQPSNAKVLSLKSLKREGKDLELFYAECSEEDRDTLDLTFDNEIAFGVFDSQRLLGVARAAPTKSTPELADITVLISPLARGQRLSTPLVSHLIENILARGLTPKYRVAQDNFASQAIARRLGLKPLFRMKTWRC